MPQGEPAERSGPLGWIFGRHHSQFETPVIRSRLREGLDSAKDLACQVLAFRSTQTFRQRASQSP